MDSNNLTPSPRKRTMRVKSGVNDLATVSPNLIEEWVEEVNLIPANKVSARSHHLFVWECASKHRWLASPKNRTLGKTNCPICCGNVITEGVNDLKSVKSELISNFWDFQRNEMDPSKVGANSPLSAWWTCEFNHSFKRRVSNVCNRGFSCPFCSYTSLLVGFNDLATTNPEIISEWSVKNNLKPENFTKKNSEKVLWKCFRGHEWIATIRNRVILQSGCPHCLRSWSKLESKVAAWLEELNIEFKQGYWFAGDFYGNRIRRELDFFIPELNIAIEVQDNATHSKFSDDEITHFRGKKLKKGPNYHREKAEAAREILGIASVIEIWEDEIYSIDGKTNLAAKLGEYIGTL